MTNMLSVWGRKGAIARWGIATEAERFLRHVIKRGRDECWLWQIKTKSRYPMFKTSTGVGRTANRVAYQLFRGNIPDGACVCHSCDNTQCCNPAHLFLGTHTENIRDAQAKGRLATGKRSGAYRHPERVARGERHGSQTRPECVPRGEQAGKAKLTEAQVREARKLRVAGTFYTDLGRKYGVNNGTIHRAINGKSWKHVT